MIREKPMGTYYYDADSRYNGITDVKVDRKKEISKDEFLHGKKIADKNGVK